MDKPILFYAVRQQPNRATGGTLFVPAIVEREEIVPGARVHCTSSTRRWPA